MNSKTRLTTLLIIFFLGLGFNSLAQSSDSVRAWTILECVDYALENNLQVKNQALNVGVSEVNALQSKMNFLPSLNASGNYGRNWGFSIDPESNRTTNRQQDNGFASMNLNWVLFSGLNNINTKKQSEANVLVAEYNLDKQENDIILLIVTYYTNVIFNRELLENAKSQLESTQSQYDRTKKQVDAGALPLSNALDLQAQVANSELGVINAENALSFSMLQLKQVMQIPGNQPLEIVIPEIELNEADLVAINPNDVYQTALSTMPEIKSADMSIESSYRAIKIAQSNYYPRITLSAGLNTNYSTIAAERGLFEPTGNAFFVPIGQVQTSGETVISLDPVNQFANVPYQTWDQLSNNFGQSIGLGISIPIFNRLQVNSGVQRAKISLEQAEINAEFARQTLRQTIETAYNDVYSSAKFYQSSLKGVEAREESFRATKQRFENGAANATDYEVAENQLFQARSDLLRAKYDYIFKLKILDFYQGKPIDF
jgi:outer membrane protein